MEPIRGIIALALAPVRGVPKTLIRPRVGRSRPSSIFMVVDLPEPLGPRNP